MSLDETLVALEGLLSGIITDAATSPTAKIAPALVIDAGRLLLEHERALRAAAERVESSAASKAAAAEARRIAAAKAAPKPAGWPAVGAKAQVTAGDWTGKVVTLTQRLGDGRWRAETERAGLTPSRAGIVSAEDIIPPGAA